MLKCSPVTVTDAYPLSGVLVATSDAMAASKLKTGDPVPATIATVTVADLKRSAIGFV
jgi:hypothetical protein